MTTINEGRLAGYLAAEASILKSQSFRMGDRELQRADLGEIRAEISRLQMLVNREQASAAGRGGRFSQADFGGQS